MIKFMDNLTYGLREVCLVSEPAQNFQLWYHLRWHISVNLPLQKIFCIRGFSLDIMN